MLKNSQPLVADVTSTGVTLHPTRFTGRDTNLTASGTIPFTTGVNTSLALDGDINLAILQLVNPDLLAGRKGDGAGHHSAETCGKTPASTDGWS